MSNKLRKLFVFLLILSTAVVFQNCGKKDGTDKKDDGKNKSKDNSELIKKDEKGQKVDLKLKPNTGDLFKYKLTRSSNNKESDAKNQNDFINTESNELYYYNLEIADVNDFGTITYKVKFDSITTSDRIANKDSSILREYNSNRKDTSSNKEITIYNKVYNHIINNAFRIRVNSNNEFIEVYELEVINEKLFTELGDTLSSQSKDQLKDFVKSVIKDVLLSQFQPEFPKTEIYKDSTWSKTTVTENQMLPLRNIATYKIKDIQKRDNSDFIVIDGKLDIEFINKEYKEKGGSVLINDITSNGNGTIEFNLTKGNLAKKETIQSVKINYKKTLKGASLYGISETAITVKIELL